LKATQDFTKGTEARNMVEDDCGTISPLAIKKRICYNSVSLQLYTNNRGVTENQS